MERKRTKMYEISRKVENFEKTLETRQKSGKTGRQRRFRQSKPQKLENRVKSAVKREENTNVRALDTAVQMQRGRAGTGSADAGRGRAGTVVQTQAHTHTHTHTHRHTDTHTRTTHHRHTTQHQNKNTHCTTTVQMQAGPPIFQKHTQSDIRFSKVHAHHMQPARVRRCPARHS